MEILDDLFNKLVDLVSQGKVTVDKNAAGKTILILEDGTVINYEENKEPIDRLSNLKDVKSFSDFLEKLSYVENTLQTSSAATAITSTATSTATTATAAASAGAGISTGAIATIAGGAAVVGGAAVAVDKSIEKNEEKDKPTSSHKDLGLKISDTNVLVHSESNDGEVTTKEVGFAIVEIGNSLSVKQLNQIMTIINTKTQEKVDIKDASHDDYDKENGDVFLVKIGSKYYLYTDVEDLEIEILDKSFDWHADDKQLENISDELSDAQKLLESGLLDNLNKLSGTFDSPYFENSNLITLETPNNTNSDDNLTIQYLI
jgi:hypothetical protein